jgi:hypothetical protein
VKYLKENNKFERLALHAFAVTFIPPDSKAPKTIQTKGIPKEMEDLFSGDKNSSSRCYEEVICSGDGL